MRPSASSGRRIQRVAAKIKTPPASGCKNKHICRHFNMIATKGQGDDHLKTIIHNGHEYSVVRDWEEDEKLAYRELGNGHIEVLTIFVGEAQTVKVHVGFLNIVLQQREMNKEVTTSHGNYATAI